MMSDTECEMVGATSHVNVGYYLHEISGHSDFETNSKV